MDVKIGDVEIILLYEGQDLVGLVDGDTEFTLVMARGNFQVTDGHDIWPEADTDGVAMPIFANEFFQVGEAVDVNDDAKCLRFFDLVEADTVRGIQNSFFGEAGVEGQPYFVDGAAIDVGAEATDVL